MRLMMLALLAGSALAQNTRLPLDQIKTPPQPAPMIFMALPSGAVIVAQLGGGLTLDSSTKPPTLKATSAAPPQLAPAYSLERASRVAVMGTWSMPAGCGIVAVYRNGLVQWPGVDYTLTALGDIQFRFGPDPTDPSSTDDIVTALCRR